MFIITWLGGKTFKKQKWLGSYYILTVNLERLNCEGFATMVFAMCLLSVTLSKQLRKAIDFIILTVRSLNILQIWRFYICNIHFFHKSKIIYFS